MITHHSESIQKQFGNVAAKYGVSVVHAQGKDLNTMVEAAHLQGTEQVLDAGCGAGHTALAFAERARSVVAYDLTPEMLTEVQKLAQARNLSNISAHQGNVTHMPFATDYFDLVVSRYSAHHWSQPEVAIHEMWRVLKPGGQIIISDVVSYDDYTLDTFLQTIEMLRDPSHVRDHSIQQWRLMFMNVGLQSEVLLNFDVRLGFKDWLARMQTSPTHAAVIRSLFTEAPPEVQAAFQLGAGWQHDDDFEFIIPGAVIRAWRE